MARCVPERDAGASAASASANMPSARNFSTASPSVSDSFGNCGSLLHPNFSANGISVPPGFRKPCPRCHKNSPAPMKSTTRAAAATIRNRPIRHIDAREAGTRAGCFFGLCAFSRIASAPDAFNARSSRAHPSAGAGASASCNRLLKASIQSLSRSIIQCVSI